MRFLVMIALLSSISCTGVINTLAFYPDTVSAIPESSLPEYIHKVKIKTLDGLVIEGLLFNKTGVSERSRLIIYFHGNAGNMYHRIDEATELNKMGYDILIVSYRGYAKSEGKPSEKGIYIDGKSALQYATDQLGYRLSSIIIFGRSIGSTVAVDVSQNLAIYRLILITPLSTGFEFAEANGFGRLSRFAGTSFDNLKKINNVKCPLLVVHGDRDEVVPYKFGLKLFQKYDGIKEMVTIPDGRHNDLEIVYPQLYWSSIKKFLNKE